jgi:phage regulator Rha-like protein
MNEYHNIDLVENFENELRISHRVIAEYTNNQQKNVSELIQKYSDKLLLFGKVPFQTEAIKNSKNKTNEQKTFFLNEPQATLLLTFMRNNEIVTEFKVNLVKAFYEMRMKIQTKPEHEKVSPQKSLETVQTGIELLKSLSDLNPVEQIELDNFYQNEHGFSILKKFKRNFENHYFLPTEIGNMIGMSGAEINLILEKKGFQFRDENGVWKPTSSGKEFCLEIGNKFNQLKWRISTIL